MTVHELTEDEKEELKVNYLVEKRGEEGVFTSEIVGINEIVSDQEIEEVYQGTDFVKEDFFCNIESA